MPSAPIRARLITPDTVRSRAATIDPRVDPHELTARIDRLLNTPNPHGHANTDHPN